MPAAIGSAIQSSASRPSRRSTKAPSDSSASGRSGRENQIGGDPEFAARREQAGAQERPELWSGRSGRRRPADRRACRVSGSRPGRGGPVDRDDLVAQSEISDQLRSPTVFAPAMRPVRPRRGSSRRRGWICSVRSLPPARSDASKTRQVRSGRSGAQAVGDAKPGDARRRRSRHRPASDHALVAAWTKSTSRLTLSTGVCGRTPWPRLKMWPGRPPALVEHRLGPLAQRIPRGEQGDRIEVALDGDVRPSRVEGGVRDRSASRRRSRRRPSRGHQLEQPAGVRRRRG